jgi:parallel beta-helix repeat protein
MGKVTSHINSSEMLSSIDLINQSRGVNADIASLSSQLADITTQKNLAVNIEKFPKLTGETDDTGRIQRAIQYATSNGINIVDFNANTYVTGTIFPVSNLILRGKGIGSVNSSSTAITTIKLKNNANAHLIDAVSQVNNVQIQEMILDGNKTNQSGSSYGIYFEDSTTGEDPTWKLTNVRIRNCLNSGIYLGTNRRALKLQGCSSSENNEHGILMKASDSVISRCGFFLNGKDGIHLDIASWVTVITECAIFSNTGHGIYSFYSSYNLIYGNGIDRNSKCGVYLDASCDGTSILNNNIRVNSQAGNGLYASVHVENGSVGVNVSHNPFGVEDGFTNLPSYDIEIGNKIIITGIGNTRVSGASVNGLSNTPSRIMGNGRVFYGTAIPASGLVYNAGDVIENTSPTTGGNKGWIGVSTGKAHGVCTGDVTNGSNVIANVTNISSWSVGDNIIASTGIPFPSTVTSVNTSNNTLTISGNAWTTKTGVSFWDAKFQPYGIVGTLILTGTATPTTTPEFIGQRFIDTTNKKAYEAMGTSATTDWVVLN